MDFWNAMSFGAAVGGRAWLQRQPESRFVAHGHAAGQSPEKKQFRAGRD